MHIRKSMEMTGFIRIIDDVVVTAAAENEAKEQGEIYPQFAAVADQADVSDVLRSIAHMNCPFPILKTADLIDPRVGSCFQSKFYYIR